MNKKYLALIILLITGIPTNASEKTLRIYTYQSFNTDWGPGPELASAFESQCLCNIQYITESDAVGILNRLRIEEDKTRADIIIGLDQSLIKQAEKTELIATHNLEQNALNPILQWNNPNFIPFDYGFFAFIYNQDRISKPAQSMRELLESESTLIYADPRTSTVGNGLLYWINAIADNHEHSQKLWQQIAKRTITVTPGWTEAYNIFLEGGADYVLSYHTSPAYHIAEQQSNQYQAARFSDGHIMQIEVAAILKTAKYPELAQQFLQFLLTPTAQEIIATHNWMLPVIDNIVLPDAFEELITPDRLLLDDKVINNNRQHWLKTWRQSAR